MAFWRVCGILQVARGTATESDAATDVTEGFAALWTNAATNLGATHFWDCNGAACDATELQPWEPSLYRYAAHYAPVNASEFGGSVYGEVMWLTGAASDALSTTLGGDDGCCGGGGESGGGGCGKCILVRNKEAVNSDWSAVVMKKNRCPPWSNECDAKLHIDIAVPGYDNLQFSDANICGQANTKLTKKESAMCGDWYTFGSDTASACDCSQINEDTPESVTMKRGCKLFSAWGWKNGNPMLEWVPVSCPPAFVSLISTAFGPAGAATMTTTTQLPSSTTIAMVANSTTAAPVASVSPGNNRNVAEVSKAQGTTTANGIRIVLPSLFLSLLL
eukprot:gnl/MRDRNA2_/MRDRNA2_101176_c0_seq1.p1 gnl/MRDRNA2_/MRDRNA2_101176_c0~~gnl/MRDRNA2_/MRDRNA2_101176_c0_seq1.p1  ORF type:complete len:333 (+),score=52.40 gnl/MRDRNA2_/MRDRNA2_101176_c0_seq1:52-1050(+)